MIDLILTCDEQEIFRSVLAPGDYVIGREPGVEILAEVPDLSRRHARLFLRENDLRIEDLGSSNGTWVDEMLVTGEVSILGKGSVRLGDVFLEIRGNLSAGGSKSPAGGVPALVPPELMKQDRYVVGGVVAHGGMGNILDAHQTCMRREVAMKVIRGSAGAGSLRRFINEARVTGELEHPNIVPVHEIGVDPTGQVFYTMKFVRGQTLAEVIAYLATHPAKGAKQYPLATLLTVFQKVCDALAFAHSRGVIHRDLKPENIMLGDFGEVLVMDWGLAKRTGASGDSNDEAADEPLLTDGHTQAGAVLGTPRYMAPEQARGEVSLLDGRSDIYALGTILHELLYLRPLVSGNDSALVLEKVASGVRDKLPKEWKAPHVPGGRIPSSLRAVRRKAIAFEPDQRYQHVGELQADISAYQAGFATGAEGAGLSTQLALLVKRHRGVSTSIGLSLLLLAAVVVGYTSRLVLARERATDALANVKVQHERAEEALARVEKEQILTDQERRNAESALAKLQDQIQHTNAAIDSAGVAISQKQVMQGQTESTLAKVKDALSTLQLVGDTLMKLGKPAEAARIYGLGAQVAPQNASFQLSNGNALQASKQLPQAIAAYRKRLELGPDPQAQRNLEFTTSLLEKNGGEGELKPDVLKLLIDELDAQGRALEAALLSGRSPLAAALPLAVPPPPAPAATEPTGPSPSYSAAELALYHKLDSYTSQPQWNSGRISTLSGGGFRLNLSGMHVGDLAEIRSEPVWELDVSSSDFWDLPALSGFPLRTLSIHSTRVKDISPLKGLQLASLNISQLPITSITALEGMPLAELYISGLRLESLKPLRTMPSLRKLFITSANLENLTELKGLQLEELDVSSNPFASLAVLRDMPLRTLRLQGCTKIRDFSALADFKFLQTLALPSHARQLDFLAGLPALQLVSHERITAGGGGMGKAEFLELSRQSDVAWVAIKARLELTDAKDLRPDRVTSVGNNLISLDLRGTGVTQLKPLEGLQVARLAIDTPEAVLDLAPLRTMPLTHLDLSGSGIASIEPLLSCDKLESLALPFQTKDAVRLKDHPSLKRLGYVIDPTLQSPIPTVDEFFAVRAEDPDWPPVSQPGEIASERFDDAAKGTADWMVVQEIVKRELTPELTAGRSATAKVLSGWRADPVVIQGRGGGHLALAAETSGEKVAYFSAPAALLGDRTAWIGGCLEFQLRQANTTLLFDAPDVELRSGNTRLVHALPGPPTSRWQTFTVPLDPSAWKMTTLDGRSPTPREFEKVLAQVDRLLLRGEFSDEPRERTELDDVRLWEPTAAASRIAKARSSWTSLETWRSFTQVSSAQTGAAVPVDIDFTYLKHETWIRTIEGHNGVVLVHPLELEKPATITYLVLNPVAEGSRMTLVTRGPDMQPGVRIKVLHKKKVLATEILDASWRNLQVSLPRIEGGKSELVIEIWADQWDREHCYLDEVRIDPPSGP